MKGIGNVSRIWLKGGTSVGPLPLGKGPDFLVIMIEGGCWGTMGCIDVGKRAVGLVGDCERASEG